MNGKGIGEDILRGLQDVGREAVAIAAPIARETFRRKLQQGADQYIESGETKGRGRKRKGKGIGEDILNGLKQATMEAVQIAAPIAESTIRRKAAQRYGGRKGKGIGEDILRGLQSVGREAVAIAAPIARETFKRKLQQGADQYIESGEKKGGMRMKMSAAQVRTLKKGGAIQIKPSMLSDMGRYDMMVKPAVMPRMERAFMKGMGVRLSADDFKDIMDMKRGGSLFNFADATRKGVKRMTGMGMVEEVAKVMRKKHGGGEFEDFFSRQVPKALIRQGIPVAGTVAGSALGAYMGGPAGAALGATTGNMAGEAVGDYVGDKTGYGLYAAQRGRGMGRGLYAVGRGVGEVIQTGSPYINHRSPAYHPFKLKYNPFT